ncbi:MAG: hypothetical protein IJY09_00820 [Lachnospiraceae bacterium]|nr:hypothetical protein [Lachnospiraceae bacterium]
MSRTTAKESSVKTENLRGKLIAAIIAVVVLVVVILVAEVAGSRRYTIINETGTDIESIVLYLENEYEDDYFRSENIAELSVAAGAKETGRFETVGGGYLTGASMMMEIKFEGRDKVLLYSGYFVNSFDGRIKLVFKEDAENPENITVDIKAGTGLFQSTRNTDCDETQDLFLDE